MDNWKNNEKKVLFWCETKAVFVNKKDGDSKNAQKIEKEQENCRTYMIVL